MNNGKNKIFKTGISITEFEREIVERESERRALFNFSATLRQLLREWYQLKMTDRPLPTAELKDDTQE